MKQVAENQERTIGKYGGSKTITIPSEFEKYLPLEAGAKMDVGLFADDDGLLIVARKKKE